MLRRFEIGAASCGRLQDPSTNRGDWIRTSDLSLPKRVRYQAAPRPVGYSVDVAPAIARALGALLGSAGAMADVQPLRALHYDTTVVGPLADVVAPPYDVIDASQRAALIGRSP